jgi:hypothetical protein
MADTKAEKAKKPVAPDNDTRYRYIGFEVYSKKTKKFWKSDAEFDKHLKKAQSVETFSDWDRDFSLVKEEDITATDRVVLAVSNIILLITLFLPWLSYRTAAGVESTTWFGALGLIGTVLGGAFQVGNGVGLAAICGVIVLIATPVLAILGLLMLFGKASDAYIRRLRLILRLNYVGFAAWNLALIFSLAGGDITPLTSAGLMYIGESFTIVTVFKLVSYGAIIPVALFFLNAIKSNEL